MKKLTTMLLVPALAFGAVPAVHAQENVTPAETQDTAITATVEDTSDTGSSETDTAGDDLSSDVDPTAVGVGAFFGMVGVAGLLGLIVGNILKAFGVQPFM